MSPLWDDVRVPALRRVGRGLCSSGGGPLFLGHWLLKTREVRDGMGQKHPNRQARGEEADETADRGGAGHAGVETWLTLWFFATNRKERDRRGEVTSGEKIAGDVMLGGCPCWFWSALGDGMVL